MVRKFLTRIMKGTTSRRQSVRIAERKTEERFQRIADLARKSTEEIERQLSVDGHAPITQNRGGHLGRSHYGELEPLTAEEKKRTENLLKKAI